VQALAYEFQPAPPPPTEPRPPQQRWYGGRLWVGPFLVPDHPFLLHPPCPCCNGPVYHDTGDFRCLHCGRDMLILAISPTGRVIGLAPRQGGVPALTRIAPKQARETYRALSRADGTNGLQARVLRLLPQGESYAVVETLATTLSVRRSQVRVALEQLEAQGLVCRHVYAAGYRTGWRRLARENRP
jgi:biotin operon repressor